MAKHGSKLRSALDRHQGKDHKLLKQRKHEKEVHKKKDSLKRQRGEESEDEDAEATELVKQLLKENGYDENDIDVSGSDEDESGGFDLARLDESDSDDEEDDGDELQKTSESASGSLAKADQDDGQDDDEEDEDDDDDEDIPLSELSDAGSGDEDIVPHQRLTINNTSALQRALASIALPTSQMTFSEHMSTTTSEPVDIPDVEDDLNRELAFYAQSLSAVKDARSRLRKEGVPFTRPADYFAEMVKSDEHMGKIKNKLIEDAANKKGAQEARRQRDLKKFGKQVQQEKLKERAKAKKDMLEKVGALKRKRQGAGLETANEDDMFDVALEDAATTEKKDREARRSKSDPRKRQKKDQKYGFGGKKRFAKSGDAASTGDMRDFSSKKMKAGGKARPGKNKRAKLGR